MATLGVDANARSGDVIEIADPLQVSAIRDAGVGIQAPTSVKLFLLSFGRGITVHRLINGTKARSAGVLAGEDALSRFGPVKVGGLCGIMFLRRTYVSGPQAMRFLAKVSGRCWDVSFSGGFLAIEGTHGRLNHPDTLSK